MRICYLADGSSIHTIRWANWFANKGHKILLMTAHKTNKKKYNKNIKIIDFSAGKTKLINYIKLLFFSRKILKNFNPDIVHAHYITRYGICALFCGKPYVVSAWGSDLTIFFNKPFGLQQLIKYVLKKTKWIHVGDLNTKNKLISLGYEKDKIFAQEWGTDFQLFNSAARSTKLRKQLKVVNYLIISANSLEPIYNLSAIIKNAPYVIKKIPNVKFIFVNDGSLKQKLKNLTTKLNITKNFIFANRIPNQKMPSYLASSDLLVDTLINKSPGAGLGIANSEAMACGTPVIIRKPINLDNKNFNFQQKYRELFYFDPTNHLGLGKVIVNILQNKKFRRQIRNKGSKLIKKVGDWNKNMSNIEQQLQLLTKY